MQRDVGQGRAKERGAIGVGPPGAIPKGHRPVDGLERPGVARGGNGGQHPEIAPAVHRLFQMEEHRWGQPIAKASRNRQFQRPSWVRRDEFLEFPVPLLGQFEALGFQGLLGRGG